MPTNNLFLYVYRIYIYVCVYLQETDLVYDVIDKAVAAMKSKGIRVKVDNRDHLRPGNVYISVYIYIYIYVTHLLYWVYIYC